MSHQNYIYETSKFEKQLESIHIVYNKWDITNGSPPVLTRTEITQGNNNLFKIFKLQIEGRVYSGI